MSIISTVTKPIDYSKWGIPYKLMVPPEEKLLTMIQKAINTDTMDVWLAEYLSGQSVDNLLPGSMEPDDTSWLEASRNAVVKWAILEKRVNLVAELEVDPCFAVLLQSLSLNMLRLLQTMLTPLLASITLVSLISKYDAQLYELQQQIPLLDVQHLLEQKKNEWVNKIRTLLANQMQSFATSLAVKVTGDLSVGGDVLSSTVADFVSNCSEASALWSNMSGLLNFAENEAAKTDYIVNRTTNIRDFLYLVAAYVDYLVSRYTSWLTNINVVIAAKERGEGGA